MVDRRRFVLAMALALLAPGFASRAQNARPSPYVRDFGYVTLHDGVKLAYVAYRPSAEGKFPTVMTYDPYVAAGSGPNASTRSAR